MIPGRPVLIAATLVLFAVWSNSFVAAGYLLGGETRPAVLSWDDLVALRFLAAAVPALAWCLVRHRRQFLLLVRSAPGRLVGCGLLIAPVYGSSQYYGQQHGVPAPIVSLTTTLAPLFVIGLAAVALGESIPRRRIVGLVVATVGMTVVAVAGQAGLPGRSYFAALAVSLLAPLSFAIFTIVAKPIGERVDPLVWTYAALGTGALFLLPVAPRAVARLPELDAAAWAALGYLVVACTLFGYAVWVWLLRHLPANLIGVTIFLNPPLTTLSKAALAALFPATFRFAVTVPEILGGAIVLLGVALAVGPGSARRTGPTGGSPGPTAAGRVLPERPV